MPESAQLNILIETGADFVLPHTIYDNDHNPVDLTGARVTAQLREFAEAADAYDFICWHNGTGGKIWISMPHETTSQIPFAEGEYDVKVTLADGTVSYPLVGDVIVREGVTKSYDGAVLIMLGISSYEALPEIGNPDRLYFVYDDRKIYRWNGLNYIATAVGNGIQRIDFVEHSSPFTDTYRVTYDDGTTWDYQVTCKGIQSIELISSTGDYLTGTTDTYRIHFNSGDYYDYSVKGGRVVFPYFYIDWDTGHLIISDEMANLTFTLNQTTGHLSYSY